jgi:murein DD-endopeptidase MepM/ murein hydrolase activator NlpD
MATIKYIVFPKSLTDFVVINLCEELPAAYPFTKEITYKRKFVSGTINSSLWNTMKEVGSDPLLAIKLSDVYAWQIDFFDVKEGDSFSAIYNEAYIDDTTALNISSIEAAVFTHQGKTYNAIPFMQDSIQEYYDEEGKSLRKAFLKAPLDFFRITSKYTNARFHPILQSSSWNRLRRTDRYSGKKYRCRSSNCQRISGWRRKLYQNPSQFGIQHDLYAPV